MSGTYVVRAGDPVLRSQALATLLDELVAGEDRTLVVEEHTVPGRATSSEDGGGAADERSEVVAAILNAVQSPPLVTTRRVVVVHDPEHLTADEAAPLVAYLATPLETTTLVMVGAGGRLPRPLGDALRTATTVGPRSEHTEDVLDDALGSAGLRLEPAAARAVAEHLGEDAGRIGALVEVLGAAHGPGVTLALDDVTPYLGEAGPVPAYLLTNRIEEGDAAGALETLHRLVTVTTPRQPRPMHPLQVLGILQSRYRRLLRVDDPQVRTAADAHAALGRKPGTSTFPARKILEASRALGSNGLRRAIGLLHRADLELKGASGLPADAVTEMLVVRLAALHARARSASGRSRAGPGRVGIGAGPRSARKPASA